jgi:hypothetical protein
VTGPSVKSYAAQIRVFAVQRDPRAGPKAGRRSQCGTVNEKTRDAWTALNQSRCQRQACG